MPDRFRATSTQLPLGRCCSCSSPIWRGTGQVRSSHPSLLLLNKDARYELSVVTRDGGSLCLQPDVDLEPVGYCLAVLLPPSAVLPEFRQLFCNCLPIENDL